MDSPAYCTERCRDLWSSVTVKKGLNLTGIMYLWSPSTYVWSNSDGRSKVRDEEVRRMSVVRNVAGRAKQCVRRWFGHFETMEKAKYIVI